MNVIFLNDAAAEICFTDPPRRQAINRKIVFMKLYVKNMVSQRCKIMVAQELARLGIAFRSVELGYVELSGEVTAGQLEDLGHALSHIGLSLLASRKGILVERTKNTVSALFQDSKSLPKMTYSHIFQRELNAPYSYISRTFREETGITLEHYMIVYRIECVKELLQDPDNSLTDVAFRMNYSSVAHLSRQFRAITGWHVSVFRRMEGSARYCLEEITR